MQGSCPRLSSSSTACLYVNVLVQVVDDKNHILREFLDLGISKSYLKLSYEER